MSVRQISLAAALIVLSSGAMAQSDTPEERAACRPDVRRFCYTDQRERGVERVSPVPAGASRQTERTLPGRSREPRSVSSRPIRSAPNSDHQSDEFAGKKRRYQRISGGNA